MSLFGFSMPPQVWAKLILFVVLIGIIAVSVEYLQDMPEPGGRIASYVVTPFIVFTAIIIGIKMALKPDVKLDDSNAQSGDK